ncbi:hypothetical protein ACFCYH_34460 [Streptomyces sp. NPDC056400]|uniref:hypothetical protein n=1 Tax=Streptomyces sp. NPDC056400 TaxID=3345808 RepID=UPI0035DD7EA8
MPGDKVVHGTASVTAPSGGNGGFTLARDADGEPVTWTGSRLLRGGRPGSHRGRRTRVTAGSESVHVCARRE